MNPADRANNPARNVSSSLPPILPPGSGVGSAPVNGVRTGPSGSFGFPTPKSPGSHNTPLDPYRVVTPPAPINSSKGGTDTGRYAMGEQLGGRGEAMQTLKPEGRPKPNQGTRGTGGVIVGGERPGAVPITGPNPTIPKTPGRIASFFGGMRGGSGGGGGLFGIKNK